MKVFVFLAIALCAYAAEVKETEKDPAAEPEQNKEKRQTRDEYVPSHLIYRQARKQEQVAPVEEPQDEEKGTARAIDSEEYRPGQVYSLNAQELLELQPERKAPLSSNQLLQQLFPTQQEHKQDLQQFYYIEPQSGRQVALQPSHAVIARPHYSSDGGEASVGAALSVSDTGASPPDSFDQELLALLGHAPGRAEEPRQPVYAQAPQQQVATQSVAPQYQQVDRYITKPSKKPTKLRSKVQIAPPQSSTAPQQYLIETTNVQQQQQHQIQQQQQQPQYRPQPQRQQQALRYVTIQPTQSAVQQVVYERPDNLKNEGLKVVAPPKFQPQRPLQYRLIPQFQAEAAPKQYRIVDQRPQQQQQLRQEQRISATSVERPVTYLKRFPEPEKTRTVKIYEPAPEALQQQQQILGDQYYVRPVYRTNEQRGRYEVPLGRPKEQARAIEQVKPPHSAIYVTKNVAPKKPLRPQPVVRIEQKEQLREQSHRIEQPTSVEQVNIEQHGQSLEEQRSHLPPPRNNKAYTPEEFAALVAAGYAVTPIPVGPVGPQLAQSRSSVEAVPEQPKRRLYSSRRHQYLPLRGDDAP